MGGRLAGSGTICPVVLGSDKGDGRWIIAANRGPVEFTIKPDGELVQQRGSGGLVTALSALTPHLSDSVWICAPRTNGDRSVALEAPEGILIDDGVPERTTKQRVKLLDLDHDSFERYYSVISNPIIWFVQHQLCGSVERAEHHGRGTRCVRARVQGCERGLRRCNRPGDG